MGAPGVPVRACISSSSSSSSADKQEQRRSPASQPPRHAIPTQTGPLACASVCRPSLAQRSLP